MSGSPVPPSGSAYDLRVPREARIYTHIVVDRVFGSLGLKKLRQGNKKSKPV